METDTFNILISAITANQPLSLDQEMTGIGWVRPVGHYYSQ